MEKARKSTVHDLKCTTNGMDMYGWQWNWPHCIDLLMISLLTIAVVFWSVQGDIICSDSAKCFEAYWTRLWSTEGQWPKVCFKSNPKPFNKEVKFSAIAKSITWAESGWAAFHMLKTKQHKNCIQSMNPKDL